MSAFLREVGVFSVKTEAKRPSRNTYLVFAFCNKYEINGAYTEDGNHKKLYCSIKEGIMAELFEAIMLICFGLSWPVNAWKSFKARTAAGSSWQFIALITVGYLFGIAAKFLSGSVNWVLAVYFINLICIGFNWFVYFRNRALDKRAASEEIACEIKLPQRAQA